MEQRVDADSFSSPLASNVARFRFGKYKLVLYNISTDSSLASIISKPKPHRPNYIIAEADRRQVIRKPLSLAAPPITSEEARTTIAFPSPDHFARPRPQRNGTVFFAFRTRTARPKRPSNNNSQIEFIPFNKELTT